MFNILKLFKKDNKNEKIINIPESIYKNKKIISFWDLYQIIGINIFIEEMIKDNEFKKYHYHNIQANVNTCKKLDEFIKNNLIHTKNKYSKIYNEKVLLNMAAMDSLQWSPKMEDDLPDNIIRIILPGHKNFTKVTKEMLSWNQ